MKDPTQVRLGEPSELSRLIVSKCKYLICTRPTSREPDWHLEPISNQSSTHPWVCVCGGAETQVHMKV